MWSFTCKHTCFGYIQITTLNNKNTFGNPYFWGDHVNYLDHVYLRNLSTEYRSILSVDMSTDTRPICRPTVGRYVDRYSADMSAETRSIYRPTVGRHPPILHRHSADTRPILYRHSASTTLIWSVLVTEFYLLYSTVT